MSAEFIEMPISGKFTEKHIGNVTSNATWILFTNNKYEQWVASFDSGWSGYSNFIIPLEEHERAFVVVGGVGYLVDISNQDVMNFQFHSGIKTIIYDEVRGRAIYSDGLDIRFINYDGVVSILYDSRYFDDVELLEIKENTLHARYWYYQGANTPFSFEMNLVTGEIRDSYDG
jgi:hypothetical protein